MAMPKQQPGKSRQDYSTDGEFMGVLNREFGKFSYDLAANAKNTKARHWYGPKENSLEQSWHGIYGVLWLNPPFNRIGPWVEKCADEMARGANIMLLVPASVGSGWWGKYVHNVAPVVYLLGHRLHFIPGEPAYPKDCALVVYSQAELHIRHETTTRYVFWKWKKENIKRFSYPIYKCRREREAT